MMPAFINAHKNVSSQLNPDRTITAHRRKGASDKTDGHPVPAAFDNDH